MTDVDKHKDPTPLLTALTSQPATNIVQEKQEKIFMNRKQSLKNELEWLKGKKVVSEALDADNWQQAMVMIAANLGEKRTVMMDEQRSQQRKQPLNESASIDSSTENSRSSAGVVGWKDIMGYSKARKLEMSQQKELDELQEKKLVLKSLQDRHQRFEETAQVLFGRRDKLQKRSGNIIVSLDDDNDEDLQNRAKHHTQTLLDVVFRVPSARKKMHKKLLNQTRQEAEERGGGFSQDRFSKSADHIKFRFDADSSSGTSGGSTHEKKRRINRKAKKNLISKSSTLPYLKRLKGNYQKAINTNHVYRKDALGKHLLLGHELGYDTLEEVSEGEGSVASASTLRSASALKNEMEKLVPAPSPLHVSSLPVQDNSEPLDNDSETPMSPLMVEFDGTTTVCESRESEYKTARRDGNNKRDEEGSSGCGQEDNDGCGQRENSEFSKESVLQLVEQETHLEISTVQGNVEHTVVIEERRLLTNEIQIEGPLMEESSNGYGRFPGQQSLSDSSATSSSFLTQSSLDSSIKSTDGEFSDQLWEPVPLDDILLSRSTSINTGNAHSLMEIPEIPVLPPAANGSIGIETTRSWLDRYVSEPGLMTKGLSSDSAQSGDDESNTYPQVSDISFTTNTPSDPGITPFVFGGSEHPLSTGDFSDLEPTSRWKGNLVPPTAWEDPGFREYSETLDHEPTSDDVVLYKMFIYSEAIEEKFESKLEQIIGEAFVLAMKDQLSYLTYCKLSQKLALQASGIKEGTLLVAVLGRNLLEKLPALQEQIKVFTSRVLQECYFYPLDVGSSTDLSEIHSDYDDWMGTTASVEIQNTILQENAPFIEPVKHIPTYGPDVPLICSELPAFPPNRDLYIAFLLIPRPRIRQARSVEVLFKEQTNSVPNDEIDGGEVETVPVETAEKFTPPKRTVSESSFLESDARKSSVCSVFDSVGEDVKQVAMRKSSLYENGIIKADNREDVWEHLKSMEVGQTDTLPRPIVISTSSIDPSKRPPSRHSSLESIGSSSSDSTTDSGGGATGRSQSPMVGGARKTSGLPVPSFDVISEEHEYSSVTVNSSSTADSQVNQFSFEYIHIIKPQPKDDSGNDEGDKEPTPIEDPNENEDDLGNEPPEGNRGRRRSSAEVITEVATPVLMVGLPLVVMAISAFKN